MADWKQITARIRRARTGKDPAAQLSNLYQKTRDAMVAFELAKFFETAGQSGEAAKWNSTAAERFRRADWKTKAQEAAARLGGQTPTDPLPLSDDLQLAAPVIAAPEPGSPFEQTPAVLEAIVAPAPELPVRDISEEPRRRVRRRGRPGVRNRRKSRTRPDAPAALSAARACRAQGRDHAPP